MSLPKTEKQNKMTTESFTQVLVDGVQIEKHFKGYRTNRQQVRFAGPYL